MQPVLSLCMPTNGIIEWVIPVLNSIYSQNVKLDEYEVIVTDNGDNEQFEEMMKDFQNNHVNLKYRKTRAVLFENQLEALKIATGQYLKFINHRETLVQNAISEMISFIKKHSTRKPVIFFSNGLLGANGGIINCKSFDEFIYSLKRHISWTTGVGIWKEKYDNIPSNIVVDKISPHSCILFSERKAKEYIINDMVFSTEIETDYSKKGRYDLFKAFAVEEVSIALHLYTDGDISRKTFQSVKDDYENFVADQYRLFCVKKIPCSYDIRGFNESMGIFYSKTKVILKAYVRGFSNIIKHRIMRR